MPKRYNASNPVTGEQVSFDWDNPKPPTQDDVERISDQQREGRIKTKQKIQAINEAPLSDRILRSPITGGVLDLAGKFGLDQPWHPIEAGKELWQGLTQKPDQVPYTERLSHVVKGAMGVGGPPATALGYALAPEVTAPAMFVGGAAQEATSKALEPVPISQPAKELLSTGAGLAAGGVAGHLASTPSVPSVPPPTPPGTALQTVPPPRPWTGVNSHEIIPPRPALPGTTVHAPMHSEVPSLEAPPVITPAPAPPVRMPPAGTYEAQQLSRQLPAPPTGYNPYGPGDEPGVVPGKPPIPPPLAPYSEAMESADSAQARALGSPSPTTRLPTLPPGSVAARVNEEPEPAPAPALPSVAPPVAAAPPEPIPTVAAPPAAETPKVEAPDVTSLVQRVLSKKAPEAPVVNSALAKVNPPGQVVPGESILPEGPKTGVDQKYIDFFQRRKDVTIPQLQTHFGLSGDEARSLTSTLKTQGVISGDRGKYNYLKPGETPPESVDITKRTPKEVDTEKYGSRVANLRSVHDAGVKLGLDHGKLSKRAKAEFGVDSMSKMTPEQLEEFEDELRSEISMNDTEGEARIDELESKEEEGSLSADEQEELDDLYKKKGFWASESGSFTPRAAAKRIAELLTTKGPEKGALRKEWTQSGETTLQKEGAGDLARDMRLYRIEAGKMAGNLTQDYKNNIKDLSQDEFDNFMDSIQSGAKPKNPKVAKAVADETKRLENVRQKLKGIKSSIQDPIEYEKSDKSVLPDYYDKASKKIQEYYDFGSRKGPPGHTIPEDILRKLQDIKDSGGDYEASKDIVNGFFNPAQLTKGAQRIWDKMATAEVLSKLGTAAISNSSQPVNNLLITGNVHGIYNWIRSEIGAKNVADTGMTGEELALRSGSSLHSITHESKLSEGVTPTNLSEKFLEYNGFSPREFKNRVVTAVQGAELAVRMTRRLLRKPNDKYSRDQLHDWLGLDPDKILQQKGITQDQILTASAWLNEETQFRQSTIDIPPKWHSGLLPRMITLFQGFAFKQTQFMYKAIVKELARGNVRPLIPLLSSFPIVGALMNTGIDLARGKGLPDFSKPLKSILQAYAGVGTMQMVQRLAAATMANKLSSVPGGVILGDIADAAEAIYNDIHKKKSPRQNTAKFVTKNVPVVGPALKESLFPRKSRNVSSNPGEILPSVAAPAF